MARCDVCGDYDNQRAGLERPLHRALVRIQDTTIYPQRELKFENEKRGHRMAYPRSKIAEIKCHAWCDPNSDGKPRRTHKHLRV